MPLPIAGCHAIRPTSLLALLHRRKRLGGVRLRVNHRVVQARRVAKTAGAYAGAPVGIGRDVPNDIVGMLRVAHEKARWPGDVRRPKKVEVQIIAKVPRDHVIGAGCVATDADAAHSPDTVVQSEPAAEDIYAADYLTDHWIGGRAIGCGVEGAYVSAGAGVNPIPISSRGGDRIAIRQSVEAAPGLRGGVEIGRGQRKLSLGAGAGYRAQAQAVCRGGLLGGNRPGGQPLIHSAAARESDGANRAVLGDDGRPHIEAEASVATSLNG